MKKILFLLVVVICFGSGLPAVLKAQTGLQSKIDLLIPGETSLTEIKKILGEPASQTQKNIWWGTLTADGFFGILNRKNSLLGEESTKGLTKRILYELAYPKEKIILSAFDNPSNLYSVEIEHPDVTVLNAKIGDPLEKIENLFGVGGWYSTDESDYWWLEYEEKSIRFVFLRDPNAQKFPMKLAELGKVVKIEKYDNRVSFGISN